MEAASDEIVNSLLLQYIAGELTFEEWQKRKQVPISFKRPTSPFYDMSKQSIKLSDISRLMGLCSTILAFHP